MPREVRWAYSLYIKRFRMSAYLGTTAILDDIVTSHHYHLGWNKYLILLLFMLLEIANEDMIA